MTIGTASRASKQLQITSHFSPAATSALVATAAAAILDLTSELFVVKKAASALQPKSKNALAILVAAQKLFVVCLALERRKPPCIFRRVGFDKRGEGY